MTLNKNSPSKDQNSGMPYYELYRSYSFPIRGFMDSWWHDCIASKFSYFSASPPAVAYQYVSGANGYDVCFAGLPEQCVAIPACKEYLF
jgi:hypothetical protein